MHHRLKALFLSIVLTSCCLTTLARLHAVDTVVIGIAGGTASGKTTIALKIQEALQGHAVLLQQDCYYKDQSALSESDRERVNFDHPDTLDFALMKEHLLALKHGETIEKPQYDFRTHQRELDTVSTPSAEVIIVEGILLFAVPSIRELCDVKIFIAADDDIRVLRRINRDIKERGRTLEGVTEQYLTTVRPMHLEFVEPSMRYADIIIPSEEDNEVAVNFVISRLKAMMPAQ